MKICQVPWGEFFPIAVFAYKRLAKPNSLLQERVLLATSGCDQEKMSMGALKDLYRENSYRSVALSLFARLRGREEWGRGEGEWGGERVVGISDYTD